MNDDILKNYQSDCYPIYDSLGVNAYLDFKKPSYLHHFTSSEDTEFYYSIQLFSKIPYHEETIYDKDNYFLALHLYNYDDLGIRMDIIQNAEFYDTFEEIIDTLYPVQASFLKHHRYAITFTGEEKYSIRDFTKTVASWKKTILET